MTEPKAPRTILGWLLPFILGGAAVLAHWLLNVPPGPLPPPAQTEEPKKKPTTPAPAGDDDDDKDKAGDEPFTTPRSDTLLAQIREAYGGTAFKSEPTFEAWSLAHRPLINQIVSASRVQAFKGVTPVPSIAVAGVECHTIRCRFTLSSVKTEDIQKLLDTMQGLQLDGASLWHGFKPDKFTEEPTKRATATPRMRTVVEVSFTRDLPRLDQIKLADGSPLRPPPPIVPATTPTGSVPAGSATATPSGPSAPGSSARPGSSAVPGATAVPKPVAG